MCFARHWNSQTVSLTDPNTINFQDDKSSFDHHSQAIQAKDMYQNICLSLVYGHVPANFQVIVSQN